MGGQQAEKEGTHPGIYDATGSHANYFSRALFLGRGAREGFGCDDTRDATRRLEPRTVLPAGYPVVRVGTLRLASVPRALGPEESIKWPDRPAAKQRGPPRSSGQTACATRASRYRAARRSVCTVPYAAIQLTLYYFDREARGVVDTEVDVDVFDRSLRLRQPLAGSVTTRPRSKALVATVRVLPAHDLAR